MTKSISSIRVTSIIIWFRAKLSKRTPSLRIQSLFYKRISMMLEAGVPLGTSLRLLADEGNMKNDDVLTKMVEHVEAGVTLARALSQSGYPLPPLSSHIIMIGETSGTLPENLAYLAQLLKERALLRAQIIQALIYPAIILIATFGIALFLIVGILPKIMPIFQSMKSELPLSTRLLVTMSHYVASYWWVGLIVVAAGISGVIYGLRYPKVRLIVDRLLLQLPIIGRLVTVYAVAMSSRTLGLLLQSEVRIGAALRIVAESNGNVVCVRAWHEIAVSVEGGQLLSQCLRTEAGLFPPLFIQMIQAGEATGRLRETLRYLADMYESDMRDQTRNFTALLEPLLMLLMGLVVGFIAVAIITPIYGITEHLHG